MNFPIGSPGRKHYLYIFLAICLSLLFVLFKIDLRSYQPRRIHGNSLDSYYNDHTRFIRRNDFSDMLLRNIEFELGLRGYHNNLLLTKERPDWCNDCFKRPYTFLIAEEEVCRNSRDIDLLVVVHSAPGNILRRNLIRDTWANIIIMERYSNVRYIFLIGHSSLNSYIKEESNNFGDLTLQNFTDTYLNLTLKTLMGFEWARTFCRQARLIMKTDDDVIVNIPTLLQVIGHTNYSAQIVHGHCFKNRPAVRQEPIEEEYRKFYTPYWRYPHSIYPPYCYGIGYIMSAQTADRILSISPNVPFFEWEDVYVGLCLKALGHRLRKVRGFELSIKQEKTYNCSHYQRTNWCVALHFNMSVARETWAKCILPVLST